MRKRELAIILGVGLSLMVSGCGEAGNQTALKEAQNVYEEINEAYKSIKSYSNDIYKACKAGTYEGENITVDEFIKETDMTEEEMLDAIKDYFVYKFGEDEAEKLMNAADTETSLVLLRAVESILGPGGLGVIVQNVYESRGITKEIKDNLENAKVSLKEIDSDYEGYESLKSYYTTTASYFDFCENLTGTFDQMQDTINDYQSDVRKYTNDLEFLFD